MNDPSAFNLAAALETWRGELSLRDALHPPAQHELTERMTATHHELVRQGYPEPDAFAMAKEAAGGDHGDAMAALWRMRRLAKWEAARWMMMGVVAMMLFQCLGSLIQTLITCIVRRGTVVSSDGYGYSSDGDSSDGDLLIFMLGIPWTLVLLAAGLGYHGLRRPNSFFLRFWRWFQRWLTSAMVCAGVVSAILSFARFGGLDIAYIILQSVWYLALAGYCFLIQRKLRTLQVGFPVQALPGTSQSLQAPKIDQWQLMLMGVFWLTLMSGGVLWGIQSISYFVSSWRGLVSTLLGPITICLTICLGALSWFIADVPLVQRITQWWMRRPWRSLLLYTILLFLLSTMPAIASSLASGPGISLTNLLQLDSFLTMAASLPFPVLLILWMKWSGKSSSGMSAGATPP